MRTSSTRLEAASSMKKPCSPRWPRIGSPALRSIGFEKEPLKSIPSFAALDNVLLAPHCIAWTDELFRAIGRAVCNGMLDLAQGKRPNGTINPEVFDRPGFQAKWQRITGFGDWILSHQELHMRRQVCLALVLLAPSF